ncbi:MAG: thioredoxin [bacterium]|uniref:Thioredoxin n=1 Tax=Candidatus Aphodosoma intestinipullorum TaxID=2840674 RepID=A0A940IF03_9BACT|nr:thioredoxin [Candidatus Aphodosoma intestinipullorum]
MALHITDSNFKEILAANAVVLVDFGAAWCGPCRSMAPVIDELATAYEGKAAVGKVDIEESPEITEEYGIRSVPTIIFFKNGELVPGKKIVGATQKPKLTAILDELI